MEDLSLGLMIGTLSVAPLIVGAVEVIKRSFSLPDRHAPLASVVIGMAFGAVATTLVEVTFPVGILLGFISGLTACGLYSGGRATLQS